MSTNSIKVKFVEVKTKDGSIMRNRGCPKCGADVVGALLESYTSKESPYEEFVTCCSQCDWSVQLRSSNP